MATILNLELDLPLADTPASRFLAWIAGGLVFLAVLALALASAAGGTARRLALEPRIVTVALPASAGAIGPDTATAEITAALEQLDGVAFVRVVPPEEVSRLVQPWLTPDADAGRPAAAPSGRCRLQSRPGARSRGAGGSARIPRARRHDRPGAAAWRQLRCAPPRRCVRWAMSRPCCCWGRCWWWWWWSRE